MFLADDVDAVRAVELVTLAAGLTGICTEPIERLSWRSSGLPWRSVPQDGVEDGDQLPSSGNQS
ncbi:hypothetical protein, partial [Methylobacterium sp. D54C]